MLFPEMRTATMFHIYRTRYLYLSLGETLRGREQDRKGAIKEDWFSQKRKWCSNSDSRDGGIVDAQVREIVKNKT